MYELYLFVLYYTRGNLQYLFSMNEIAELIKQNIDYIFHICTYNYLKIVVAAMIKVLNKQNFMTVAWDGFLEWWPGF